MVRPLLTTAIVDLPRKQNIRATKTFCNTIQPISMTILIIVKASLNIYLDVCLKTTLATKN